MEFTGNVLKVLPVQSGVSQRTGNEWRTQEFVFEYFEHDTDRFSDKVVLTIRNERIEELNLQVGDKLRCGFGHNVDEYQGRYYNRVNAYKVEKIGSLGNSNAVAAPQSGQEAPPAQQQQQAPAAKEEKPDDLPF